jgi:hypothetical protein
MFVAKHPYRISLFVQLAIAPFLVHDWDGFVFTRAVRDLLASGATPYAVAEADPAYIHLGNAWPPINTWYAYPPLAFVLMTPALAVALKVAAAPWVIRLALKLPFIAGTLALARVGADLLRGGGKAEKAAEWERMILLNPFLIFVSAAWGMFDAWIVALMLLSISLVDRGRVRLAGVAFGASALVKLFPAFAAPAILLYVARRAPRGWRDALSFSAFATTTFVLVSLPFFVPHPQGFLLQVLRMHLERPPQGLSLPAFVVDVTQMTAAQGWLHVEPPLHALSMLPLGLTLGVTIATTAAAARARDSFALTRTLVGLFIGVLYTSKVLNEQYFVIPVALYALVACGSGARWARVGYRVTTVGALVASLVMGWHFLTFWPTDVAVSLFGKPPHVLVGRIAAASGLPLAVFSFIPILISFCALLPAVVVGVRRIARECRAGARILVTIVASRLRRRRPARALVALILFGPLLVQSVRVGSQRPQDAPPLDSASRRVGAFYYLWWANPSHDPVDRDGNWNDGVSERPSDGYYSITATKLRNDFRVARANGIDLIVASFHEYDQPVLEDALRAAYDQGVAIAPLIELGEIAATPEHRSPDEGFTLDPSTATAIVGMASKALSAFAKAPAAYRPGGKLAVFLFDAYFWGGDWRPPFRKRLLERASAIAAQNARGEQATSPSNTELEQSAPADFSAMLAYTRYGHVWRRAYADMYRAFWQSIREELERTFGPLCLYSGESWNPGAPFHRGAQTALEGMSVFDASFIYSPSFVWVLHKKDTYERNWQRWVVRSGMQAQYERGAGHPVIATAMPSYDDRVARKRSGFEIPSTGPRGSTYDLTWSFGLDLAPDLVLVSTWNEFFEGSAVEPTIEHGDELLKRTGAWSERAHLHKQPRKPALIVTGESSAH